MKQDFRIIIAGGRDYNNYQQLVSICNNLISEKIKTHNVVVISGTAKGADTLGEQYAKENNLEVKRFPADWNTYGKSAGYKRNEQMADNADALIAFWNGESKGTKHMIDIAINKNLRVRIKRY